MVPTSRVEDEPSAPACVPCVSPELSVTLAVGVAGPSPVCKQASKTGVWRELHVGMEYKLLLLL